MTALFRTRFAATLAWLAVPLWGTAAEDPVLQVSAMISAPSGGFMVRANDGSMTYPTGTTATVSLTLTRATGKAKSATLSGELVGQVGRAGVFRTPSGIGFVMRGGQAQPAVGGTNTTGGEIVSIWRSDFRASFLAATSGVDAQSDDEKAEWCENLGELPHPGGAAILRRLSHSSSEQVRNAAAAGLKNWTALNRLLHLTQPAVKKKP